MITVSKRFEFDAAHRLMRHQGKCKNIHGHRYAFEVQLVRGMGAAIGVDGMVLDFGAIKALVKEHILGTLDHTLILEEGDPFLALLISEQNTSSTKIVVMSAAPTAEVMAKFIADRLQEAIDKDKVLGPIEVRSVKLWETPSSFATFERK